MKGATHRHLYMQYRERYSTEMKACSNFARLSRRIPRRSCLLFTVVVVVVVVVVDRIVFVLLVFLFVVVVVVVVVVVIGFGIKEPM